MRVSQFRPAARIDTAGLFGWRFGVASAAFAGLVLTAVAALAQKSTPPKPAPALTYASAVRPLLKARCVVCHNAGTVSNLAVSGGLALDSFASIRAGIAGQKGDAVLVPGSSAHSALYSRLVASSPTRLMPRGGPALPAAEIALVKRWIDAGAAEGAPEPRAEARTLPGASPMPANRGALDITLPTRITAPAGALEKGVPSVRLALKVGPLASVTALAYSPDGQRLAVGSYRAVAVWDTSTGQPLQCLTHLPGAVMAMAFNPGGTVLAVGGGVPGASGDIRFYDTITWSEAAKPLTGHTDTVLSLSWSADGKRIASGSQDRSARVWEYPDEKELRAYKDHSDAVSRVCLTADGKTLYTASLDHNARRFDVEKGGIVRVFTGHNDGIAALAISPDGKRIVTSGTEPNLRWWNVETGDTTNNSGGHGAPVNDVTFSKDGTLVASVSADKTVRLWDGSNTQQKRALEGSEDWLYCVAISPDDKIAAGAGADGVVRIWETATGRLRLSLLFWPGDRSGAAFDWIVITPEGYCDGSAGWKSKVTVAGVAKPVQAQARALLTSIMQPPSVLKAWHGAPLEPVAFPAH